MMYCWASPSEAIANGTRMVTASSIDHKNNKNDVMPKSASYQSQTSDQSDDKKK